MSMIIDGTNGVTWNDGTTAASFYPRFRSKLLTSGTTYTVPSDVKSFYVFVIGSTGGASALVGSGGIGGGGYSEKYYASPSASYTYSIGAAGANTGTAGGTTTFDVISVTGSGGVAGVTTGSAGGVGSGGDFNANGGTGGTGNTGTSGWAGGSGGYGSRAGNGGLGGNAVSGTAGGGGGSGGNNGSAGTGGSAATTKAAGALTLPFGQSVEYFDSGANTSNNTGGAGATASSYFDGTYPNAGISVGLTNFNSAISTINTQLNVNTIGSAITRSTSNNSAITGRQGAITIVEILK